jgi:hypothetical protein
MAPRHNRAVTFVILLVPAIVMSGLSLWLFRAHWIPLLVAVAGVAIAITGSTRPLRTPGLIVLVLAQFLALFLTALVSVAVDCSLHCN